MTLRMHLVALALLGACVGVSAQTGSTGATGATGAAANPGGAGASGPADPADANRDGFVSRQEFMDHMGATWDSHHSRMMRSDQQMRRDMMDRHQYSTFRGQMWGAPGRSSNPDPGQIGGQGGASTGNR